MGATNKKADMDPTHAKRFNAFIATPLPFIQAMILSPWRVCVNHRFPLATPDTALRLQGLWEGCPLPLCKNLCFIGFATPRPVSDLSK
jgi:hypothetical protein